MHCHIEILVICYFLVHTKFSKALELNFDGGYDLSIGIDPSIVEPNNLESYVQNVKATMQTFSTSLHIATWGSFYIKSVQIYVPTTWTSGPAPSYPKSIKRVHNTDIRILDSINHPRVENPNICGLSGKFIELPKDFFNLYNETPFGKQYKVLLPLWAKFRFGIWEEHGYPGSESKFPYFYKDLDEDEEENWEITGCSDVPILGTYRDQFDNEIDHACNLTQEEPLPDSCRFVPDPFGNRARSSLMHFHWMDTITGFCDETTHDLNSPNPQNLYCNYKSIREVINQTLDYRRVTNPVAEVPLTKFEIFRVAKGPVLYILLDKGKMEPTDRNIGMKLNFGIQNLVSQLGESLNISVGTYGIERGPMDLYVEHKLDWSPISEVKAELLSTIWSEPPNSTPFRDFGLAILDALDYISQLGPENGAVLLVVKTGPENGSFDKLSYEEEVLLRLKMHPIKLFTMELRTNENPSNLHLKYLTEQVDGFYYEINSHNIENSTMYETIAVNIVDEMEKGISRPSPEIFPIFIVTATVPDSWVDFFVKPNTSKVIVTLTVQHESEVYFLGETQETRAEWGESIDEHRRKVVFTELQCDGAFEVESFNQHQDGFRCSFQYTCPDNSCGESRGSNFLVIYGISSVVLADHTDLSIQFSTSAENNLLDLSHDGFINNDFPFALFIQVKNSLGIPVTNLTIETLIINYKSRTFQTLSLSDNGHGPDIRKADGIYSCSFIPESDGLFRVIGTIKNINHVSGPSGDTGGEKLLPIDQSKLNCTSLVDSICYQIQPTSLKVHYQVSTLLSGTLEVRNRNMFGLIGKPTRILDVTSKIDGTLVTLNFQAPNQLGKLSHFDNLTYCIYVNSSKETLLRTPIHQLNSTKETEINFSVPGNPTTLIFDLDGIVVEPKKRNGNGLSPVYVRINCHVTGRTNLRSELSNLITVQASIQPPTTLLTSTTNSDPESSAPTSASDRTTSQNPEISSSYATENDTSSTETLEPDDEKSFFKTGAGITVIVLIVVSCLIAMASGIWIYRKRFMESGSSRA